MDGTEKSLEYPHFVIRISVTTFQASSIEGLEVLEVGGKEEDEKKRKKLFFFCCNFFFGIKALILRLR